MPSDKFYRIIDMDHVRVSIPKGTYFSIGTSPYYAHQHGLAIDIYSKLTLDSHEIMSPVSGKVLEIRKMRAPKPRFEGALDVEYLILISNDLNEELVFKILHVKPQVKVNERVDLGDILGTTIRSGYFAPWSSTHLHLEIRNKNDAIRASGGRNFSLNLNNNKKNWRGKEKVIEKIPITIKQVLPEYLLVCLPDDLYQKVPPITGIRGFFNNKPCIIDCGIPQYKNGVIITEEITNEDNDARVSFNGSKIGTLKGNFKELGFFSFSRIKLSLNGKEIRGISSYLSDKYPLIKIIPYKNNEFSLEPESIDFLEITNSV